MEVEQDDATMEREILQTLQNVEILLRTIQQQIAIIKESLDQNRTLPRDIIAHPKLSLVSRATCNVNDISHDRLWGVLT